MVCGAEVDMGVCFRLVVQDEFAGKTGHLLSLETAKPCGPGLLIGSKITFSRKRPDARIAPARATLYDTPCSLYLSSCHRVSIHQLV